MYAYATRHEMWICKPEETKLPLLLFIAACYALRHPEHVEHLVLICPAGVPKEPEDWQQKILGKVNGWKAYAYKASVWAWESGVTPQAVIRTLGPWGASICDG